MAFFLLPIFTFYLSTKDFGVLSLYTTIFSFTLPIITLGIHGAISVYYFNGSKQNYPSYFSSSLIPSLSVAVLLTIITLIFKNPIEQYLEIPIIWIATIPIFALLSFLNNLLLIDYQIKEDTKKYVSFSLLSSLVNLLLSIFFVTLYKVGYVGRLIGQNLSILIFFLIAFYILYFKRKVLVNKISKQNIKDALYFGLPLLPHIIGGIVINMSDRFFVDYFLGKEALGIYNIGYLIGSILSVLNASFANASIPFSYKLFEENTIASKQKVVRVYWIYIAVILVSSIALVLIAPLIFKYFIDKKFIGGLIYVKWIVLSYFFQGLYLLFVNIIFYLKKTKILFYFSFVNIILNIILNYFMILNFGAIGAAYATTISFFLFFLTISIYSNFSYPLPWFKLKIS